MVCDLADGARTTSDRLDRGSGELWIGTGDVGLELAKQSRDVGFICEIRQHFQLQKRTPDNFARVHLTKLRLIIA